MLLERVVARQCVSLRKLSGGDRAMEVAFGGFVANPKVTAARVIEGWSERTRAAVAGRHVLAIQDTSDNKFSTRPGHRRGLGEVGKGNAYGVVLHAMVAVDADDGACLGLITGDVRNRPGRVTKPHAERALNDRESRRWSEAAETAKPILARARMVTVVADRESDIYAYWASAPAPDFHLLSRMMKDRRTAGGGTVWKKAAEQPFVAARGVDLPANADRAARKATLGLRFGEVTIDAPPETNISAACPRR